MGVDDTSALNPAPPYPFPFPCRIDESSRRVHCDSCAIIPELMEEIASLKKKLKDRQRKDGL